MKRPLATIAIMTSAALALCAARAQAQLGPSVDEPSVQATGDAVIRRKPEVLRLQMELSAKAATLKEALAKLKTTRETAEAKLAKFKAKPSEIKLAAPKIDTRVNAQQQQMEMMVRQRMRQSGRKSTKQPEKLVTVSCELTAEWPLKRSEPEDLLLEAQAVQDEVRAAALSSAAGEEEQAIEDEELAEEMSEMTMYNDSNQLKPGEPIFFYVGKISSDERNQAFAEAFAKAKTSAEQLSRAAGVELGPLQGLSAHAAFGMGNDMMGNYYGGYNDPVRQYLVQMASQRRGASTDSATEAIGAQPDEVSIPIVVSARFALNASK